MTSSPPVAAEPPWRHVHPLTPLVRGGLVVIAYGSWFVSDQVNRISSQRGGAPGQDPTTRHLGLLLALFLAGVVLFVALSWVSWLFSRFRLTDSLVEVRSGVLFRRHRQVRYDRIQAVDITRPVLARILRLSQVVVRSAGGHEAHLRLSFLAQRDAVALRDRLTDLATHSGAGAHADEALASVTPGRRVIQVPPLRQLQAALWRPSVLLLGLLLVGSAVELGLGHPQLAFAAVPIVLGVGSAHGRQLLNELNFVLETTPAALRAQHGLLELRATTVPFHRIQAVELTQPLLWRPFGWWRIELNVAGSHPGREATETSTILPVGTYAEALDVLALAIQPPPSDLLAAATQGTGNAVGFTTSPLAARLVDPLTCGRTGYAVTESAIVIRHGRLDRVAQIVPHARIQSTGLSEGPLERVLGIATVRLHSTRGRVHPTIPHLSRLEAERFLAEESVRAGVARATSAHEVAREPHQSFDYES